MRPTGAVVVPLLLMLLSSTSAMRIGGSGRDEDKAEAGRNSRRSASRASQPAASAEDEPAPAPAAASATPAAAAPSSSSSSQSSPPTLLVVGSLNLDVIIQVERLPAQGETVVALKPDAEFALGGKGANQAVAAARLASAGGPRCEFACQFGNDAHAAKMESTLASSGLGLDACGRSEASASGQGIAMLQAGGAVSAIVLGGANDAWTDDLARQLVPRVKAASALLLQREIPESVNAILAAAAAAAGVPVVYDVGGADRPLDDALLKLLTYVCPNETELARLTQMPTTTKEEV